MGETQLALKEFATLFPRVLVVLKKVVQQFQKLTVQPMVALTKVVVQHV
jgi:hypothetical protein